MLWRAPACDVRSMCMPANVLRIDASGQSSSRLNGGVPTEERVKRRGRGETVSTISEANDQRGTRHRFLVVAGAAATAAACSSPGASPAQVGDVEAGDATQLAVGSLNIVGTEPVCIGRDTADIYAMTLTCTHAGCDMDRSGTVSARGLVCGCHGSRFDREWKRRLGSRRATAGSLRRDRRRERQPNHPQRPGRPRERSSDGVNVACRRASIAKAWLATGGWLPSARRRADARRGRTPPESWRAETHG